MFKKLSFNIRNNILIVFTGLVISYVHLSLHHKKYLWDTFGDFILDFFCYSIWVVIFCMISVVIIRITEKYFLTKMVTENTDETDIIFYICMVLIVLSISTFIWGYGFPFNIDKGVDYEEDYFFTSSYRFIHNLNGRV